MTERRSSIIAIKNSTNPRQYLVYYDPQTHEHNQFIIEHIARDC